MSTVQLILLTDIPQLGQLGDVVKVKRGYARNHLLPTQQARTYSKEAYAVFEKEKKEIIKKQKATRAALEQQHADLNGYMLQAVMQASDEGQLYGSVTQNIIVDLLRKQEHQVSKNQITLPNNEHIKHVGEYDVEVKLADDLVATLKFSVLSEK